MQYDDYYLSKKTVRVVAKRPETRTACFSRARDLDYRSGILHRSSIDHQSYHQRSLRSMEYIPQRCGDELPVDKLNSDLLSSASGTDDFLLFAHRLHATYQGNN